MLMIVRSRKIVKTICYISISSLSILSFLSCTSGSQYTASYYPFKSEQLKREYLNFYRQKEAAWSVESETIFVNTSYGQTYVRISGNKNAPALVILHGDTENSLFPHWKEQMELLSKEYRVYMPERINDYGLSVDTKPIKKKEDLVTWLDELFLNLNLKDFYLIGYSYGGWMAALYAVNHPEEIKKLILLCPPRTVLKGYIKSTIAAIFQNSFPTRNIVTRYLYWSYSDAAKHEETRKILDEMIDEYLLCRKCFQNRPWVIPSPLKAEEWQKLKMPIIYIIGENEYTCSAQKAVRRLKSVAPDTKTIILLNAGHDLLIVKPYVVGNEILNFLQN